MKNKFIFLSLFILISVSLVVPTAYAVEEQEVMKLSLIDKNTLSITLEGFDEVNWNDLKDPLILLEIKAGYEYLFDAKVTDFEVGSSESFLWRVTLSGDFSNGIEIKEMPYEYSLYLPIHSDVFEVEVGK